MIDKKALLGIHPDTLRQHFVDAGQPGYRCDQVLQWLYRHHATTIDSMANVGKATQAWLNEHYTVAPLPIVAKQVAADQSATKYAVQLRDNQRVEAVVLNEKTGYTLCVSSQCGCGIGCRFCVTGTMGLSRNLTVDEIVGQVVLANQDTPISRLVFMGMGEPLANVQAVVAAIEILNHPKAMGIGKRKITVSTSGIIPGIQYLIDRDITLNLAFSVGHANPQKRLAIMPIEKRFSILDVAQVLHQYHSQHNRKLTLEYTLLKHTNDDPDAIDELGRLATYLNAKINLINLNPHPSIPYEPVSENTLYTIANTLKNRGLQATIRHPKGQDIVAACGQLGGGSIASM